MENIENKEQVVIVGLCASSGDSGFKSDDESLDELEALVETAGGTVVARALQKRPAPDPATLIGEGKVKEISNIVKNNNIDIIVFDNELSPSQMKNLEKALDCAVLDRTGLILDIFAKRAHTAEGKLQVELAQYKYLLPRLSGQGKNFSRQTASGSAGPIGTRGPGETKLETDRRHIRARIAKLKEETAKIRRVRGEARRRREKNEIPLVALVGYTNAGKSTLFNRITNAGVHTQNRLFDTLDPTTRLFSPDGKRKALLIDTVGFINNLPTQLIDAFRATLEELSFADLVLIVIDASDQDRMFKAKVTEELVREVGGDGAERIYVFNKADVCEPGNIPPQGAENLFLQGEDTVFVSALTGENVGILLDEIATKLYGRGIKRGENGRNREEKGRKYKNNERFYQTGEGENDRGEEREAESGGSFYRTGEGKDERGERGRGAERAEEGEGEDGGKAYRIGTAFEVLLPYGDAGMLDRLHREAEISAVDYLEQGIEVKGRCSKRLAGELKKYEKRGG